jgi:hypothetical protein
VRFLAIVREEVTEPMILLLLFVGVVYSIWGRLEDAVTIFIVIALLVLAEVWNEYRAKQAITALMELTAPRARVLRDGQLPRSRRRTSSPTTCSCSLPARASPQTRPWARRRRGCPSTRPR